MYRILVLEDESIIRRNLCDFFDWKSLDCEICCECETGEQAVVEIGKKQPDIVLADIHLSGITGIEAISQARSLCDFEAIILTGYSQFEYAKRAIELNVVDYILKPIDEELLEKAVRKAISRIGEKQKIKLYSQGKSEEFTIERYRNDTDDIYLKRVYDIILTSFRNQINLDGICCEIGLSSGYLSRKIKEETGSSFLNLLQIHRIEVAQKLIRENPNLKYYEIAEMVGFTSYKRFSEVFKKVSGSTATDQSR